MRDEDNFGKVLIVNGRIVWNHGYNQIGEKDWKLRAGDLTPDKNNPIYSEILAEMQTKPDKMAAYVFMSMSELVEIAVIVGEGIKSTNHMPHDRIASGDGDKYVKLQLLTDLKHAECGKVRVTLERTFKAAYREMKRQGGTEFSENFDFVKLRS